MKFNTALNEKFFKRKKVEKSYKEKLLDDPRYVDDWLGFDDDDLDLKIKSDYVRKADPDAVHAKKLMIKYENGEELTQEEWDFIEDHS